MFPLADKPSFLKTSHDLTQKDYGSFTTLNMLPKNDPTWLDISDYWVYNELSLQSTSPRMKDFMPQIVSDHSGRYKLYHWKLTLEPKNQPIEKENHLNQTSIFGGSKC